MVILSLSLRILGWILAAGSTAYLAWVGLSFTRYFGRRHLAGDSHGAVLAFILYALPGACGLALGAALLILGHILR